MTGKRDGNRGVVDSHQVGAGDPWHVDYLLPSSNCKSPEQVGGCVLMRHRQSLKITQGDNRSKF